jgi:F-type H+-transporting ATPase subunit gamma
MALKDIKAKIQATKRMNTVTRAMEAVSAVKMRKTQSQAFSGRAYARAALSILSRLSGTRELAGHALALPGKGTRLALVVITSDKGLAGGLNASVLKQALAKAKEYPLEMVEVYAYGKKGEDFFRNRGYGIIESFENKLDVVPLTVTEDLTNTLSAKFTAGIYAEVFAAYTNFKSTFEQLATVRKVLPLSLATVSELVKDIQPIRGMGSDYTESPAPSHYTVESSSGDVLDVLLPRLIAISLYHMMLESKASEHSARMVAMKNASDKSKEVARDFTRIYNKIRQAAITREVSEIVSGREALASQ